MGEFLTPLDIESVMQVAYQKQARELLTSHECYKKDDKSVVRVGLELESSLFDANLNQIPEEIRNAIVEKNRAYFSQELGASQIELKTPPIEVQTGSGFNKISEALSQRRRCLVTSAKEHGLYLLTSGTNPFVAIPDIVRTKKRKYDEIPEYYNRKRTGTTILGANGLSVDASIVSLLNSVQANIEAHSFSDAIDKLNRSFMISPMAIAISANARYLQWTDSSYSDVRMVAWERSFDTRTEEERAKGEGNRVGLPKRYYHDMEDYLTQVGSYPFILSFPEGALDLAIGMNWRDARIKFVGKSAVVEFRPVSSQSTVEENIAIMAFYVGRLLWSQQNNELLLPIAKVRENKNNVMKNGNNANFLVFNERNSVVEVPAYKGMQIEIQKAMEGLGKAGISELSYVRSLFYILKRNAAEGTPSSKLKLYVGSSTLGKRDSIFEDFKN